MDTISSSNTSKPSPGCKSSNQCVVSSPALHICVQFLMDHGADINKAMGDGWTALHQAAYYGYDDLAKVDFWELLYSLSSTDSCP